MITGNTKISERANVSNSKISGNAKISGYARCENAKISGNSIIEGNVYINGIVDGNSKISGVADSKIILFQIVRLRELHDTFIESIMLELI